MGWSSTMPTWISTRVFRCAFDGLPASSAALRRPAFAARLAIGTQGGGRHRQQARGSDHVAAFRALAVAAFADAAQRGGDGREFARCLVGGQVADRLLPLVAGELLEV